MGGKSEQTTTQSSQTAPWAPAQPALQGILGQLNGLISNSGLSSTASGALDQLQRSANQGNPYAGQIDAYTQNLLNGGGANAQAGNIQSGFDTYKAQVNPLASNTNYDPMQTPGLADALAALKSDISGSVNGQFAAAGRDSSGYNQQTLGRGLAQGLAPVIVDQYNKNIANQQNAAGNLYNASNTNGGLLAGLNQQSLANQGQGVTTANDALAAKNYGAAQTLNLEQLRQSIPAQNLGLLANIGVPIAGLGSQSSGTSHTQNQMSGADQFGKIAGGLGTIGKFLWG
ncbi:MAG: tail fiber domain-containing protein [Hyphomicrobium sp.]